MPGEVPFGTDPQGETDTPCLAVQTSQARNLSVSCDLARRYLTDDAVNAFVYYCFPGNHLSSLSNR